MRNVVAQWLLSWAFDLIIMQQKIYINLGFEPHTSQYHSDYHDQLDNQTILIRGGCVSFISEKHQGHTFGPLPATPADGPKSVNSSKHDQQAQRYYVFNSPTLLHKIDSHQFIYVQHRFLPWANWTDSSYARWERLCTLHDRAIKHRCLRDL